MQFSAKKNLSCIISTTKFVSYSDLKEQIARKEAEIVTRHREHTYWEEYKEKGQNDHRLQIELLKRELVDMQQSFDDMAGKISHICLLPSIVSVLMARNDHLSCYL